MVVLLSPAVAPLSVDASLRVSVVLAQAACEPGAVCAPTWLLPVAALACLSIPLAILISTGEAGTDRYNREVAGVTLQSRAVDQFKGWIDGIKDDGDATEQVRDPSQATRAHIIPECFHSLGVRRASHGAGEGDNVL